MPRACCVATGGDNLTLEWVQMRLIACALAPPQHYYNNTSKREIITCSQWRV
jgi:hypothetical protein